VAKSQRCKVFKKSFAPWRLCIEIIYSGKSFFSDPAQAFEVTRFQVFDNIQFGGVPRIKAILFCFFQKVRRLDANLISHKSNVFRQDGNVIAYKSNVISYDGNVIYDKSNVIA
jgi:hypothetical protein